MAKLLSFSQEHSLTINGLIHIIFQDDCPFWQLDNNLF